MSYEPRWDIDLRDGTEGEELVREILTGRTVEVKTDRRALETGNVYVELFQSRNNGPWKPSGINTSESAYWAFIIRKHPATVIIVDTQELRAIVNELFWDGGEKMQPYGEVRTIGVAVPMNRLVKGAKRERTD